MDCFPKVSEAYYLKLRLLAPDLLLIVESDFLKVFDLKERAIVQKIQMEDFIEEVETEPAIGIAVISLPSPNENSKEIVKWKLAGNKLILVDKVTVNFPEETYDSLFMLRVFPSGRVFFYKRGMDKIFEIRVEDKEVKTNSIPASTTALL